MGPEGGRLDAHDVRPDVVRRHAGLPQGLLPKTAEQLGSLAFVRALRAWAAVHGLAQSWAQIARNPAGILGNVAPHVGSVVSLEMQSRRVAGDVLPAFIGLNTGSMLGSGYLPARYGPFVVSRASASGLGALKHPEGTARFGDRWGLLSAMDTDRSPDSALGKPAADMNDFYGSAKTLIDSPSVNALFSYTAADYARYGSTSVGGAAILAKQLLSANQGCRFVQITLGGWDDRFEHLRGDGERRPLHRVRPARPGARRPPRRSQGDTRRLGREGAPRRDDRHGVRRVRPDGRRAEQPGGARPFPPTAALVAGGGVVGGRVIGKTDATAAKTVEFGWRANRDVRPEDLACTLYSALGIDYTTTRYDDPIARGFEYVPFAKNGVYQPVNELF